MHGSLTVREITLLQASECFNRVTVKRNLSAEPQSLTHTVLHVLMVEQSRADGSGNVCACTRVCVCVHYLSSKCRNTDITVQLALLLCESPWLSLMTVHTDPFRLCPDPCTGGEEGFKQSPWETPVSDISLSHIRLPWPATVTPGLVCVNFSVG